MRWHRSTSARSPGRRSSSTLSISRVVDKDWIISSIRRTMAEQGLLLENNKDKAQVILEVGVRGVWHGRARSQVWPAGVQHCTRRLTTGAAVSSSDSSTSLTFSETNQQDAVVKASLFAYEAKTGRLVWESAPLFNAQGVRDHFVMGSGPYRLSSRPEVAQYPERIAEPDPQAVPPGRDQALSAPTASRSDRPLSPGNRHGRRLAVQVAALVLGAILEPGDEPHELLDRFIVGDSPLLGGRQLGVAQHAGLGIAARPRDQASQARHRTGRPT